MCIGNRADSSAHYINSQLGALYENAIRCTEKHGRGLKPEHSEIEHSTCLYEFYGPGKHSRYKPLLSDLSFFAKFGRPRLEFVCNHEAILFLEILEGHYNLDYAKSSSKHLHERVEDHTVAFRVDFSTHSVKDFQCGAIGNAQKYTMDIHVLNLDSAKLVEEHSHLPCLDHQFDDRNYTREGKLSALTHYLHRYYLQTLKRAGLHVFHAIPGFDNLGNTASHVDFSMISKRTFSTNILFGIRVEDINTYLTGLWLQATSWIDEHGMDWSKIAPNKHIHSHFLAEARTSWTNSSDDMHLHMVFGPLQVQPLCKREVVLYITLQDVEVHLGATFGENHHHSLTDVKLAFIVEIDYEVRENEQVKNLKLNISSARYCEHLSSFNSSYEQEIFVNIKRTLLRYIQDYYIKTIDDSGHNCIYHKDDRIPIQSDTEDGEEPEVYDFKDDCQCYDETSCDHDGVRWGILDKQLVTQTENNGFDLISTVTQGAINSHFKTLWESAAHRVHLLGEKRRTWTSYTVEMESCLADFSFIHADHGEEVFFSSSFKEPKVQLICVENTQKAVFYLHLDKGYMKTLGYGKTLLPGTESYSFSNWRLAYEVDLKLVDVTSDSLTEAVSKRSPGRSKQLIFDFSTAKFNVGLTTVPGFLANSGDFRVIRRVRESLIYYIQNCYLPVFQRAHHHVLYTIPIRDGEHYLGPSSLKFQIIPFDSGNGIVYQGLFGPKRAVYERNMIVFLGMINDHEMPSGWLPRRNLVCGSGRESAPFGSVVISREMFLQKTILDKLRGINRQTTVVPNFSGVEAGDLNLELTTWNERGSKENRKIAGVWTQIDLGHDSLDFVWNNKVNWSYEHADDRVEAHYVVKCDTHNTVSIPTSRADAALISIKGKTTLGLDLCGQGNGWSSAMSYTWSVAVKLQSHSRGMEISTSANAPKLYDAGCEHVHGKSTHAKVVADFERVFPKFINTEEMVSDLRRSLEGAWHGLYLNSRELVVSRPVFNRRGDLLLELDFRSVPVAGKAGSYVNGNTQIDAVNANGELRYTREKAESIRHAISAQPNYNRPSSLLQKNSKGSAMVSLVTPSSSRSTSIEVYEDKKSRYFTSNSVRGGEDLEDSDDM